MNGKAMGMLAVALAVIAAATAAVVISMKRADEARHYAEAAASEEAKAEAEKKTAIKNSEAESEKRRTAEANQKAKSDELSTERLSRERAQLDKEAAEENRKAKEAEAATAKAQAEAAKAKRDSDKAVADKARAEADKAAKVAEAENAKAQAEADRLTVEKLKSDKVIAEAKLLELRQIDFATMQQELMEWKRDLDEREAALKPEKTIADLSWVGGDDELEVGSNGTVRVRQKVPYLAENDRTLSKATRRLAKADRLRKEANSDGALIIREKLVGSLERLYVQSVKDGELDLADYYSKSIKSLYPDWDFKGDDTDKKKEESKK